MIPFYPGSASTRNTSGYIIDFLLAGARENQRYLPRNASHFRARSFLPERSELMRMNEGFCGDPMVMARPPL